MGWMGRAVTGGDLLVSELVTTSDGEEVLLAEEEEAGVEEEVGASVEVGGVICRMGLSTRAEKKKKEKKNNRRS